MCAFTPIKKRKEKRIQINKSDFLIFDTVCIYPPANPSME